jgi:hypothetical protein
MKKAILCGLLATATLVSAADYDMFVGGELSATQMKWSNIPDTDSELGFGIRGGFVTDDHRIYAVANMTNDLDTASIIAAADALTEPYKLAEWYSVGFFVGGHVGVNRTDKVTKTVNGLQYGGQLGAIGYFPGNVNAEIGYRYSAIDIKDIDALEAFYLAVNFKF